MRRPTFDMMVKSSDRKAPLSQRPSAPRCDGVRLSIEGAPSALRRLNTHRADRRRDYGGVASVSLKARAGRSRSLHAES